LKKKKQKDFFNLGHGGFNHPAHQTRHCERSEAIHLLAASKGQVNCIAALEITAWMYLK
jgi:hypothetical protein